MALPVKKSTKSRQGKRRSHLALSRVSLTSCSNCKAKIRPHAVCPECGWYRGKQVRTVETIKERKKRKEKEQKGKEKK